MSIPRTASATRLLKGVVAADTIRPDHPLRNQIFIQLSFSNAEQRFAKRLRSSPRPDPRIGLRSLSFGWCSQNNHDCISR